MQVSVGKKPIGRFEMMLLVRGALAMATQLSHRELAAVEQRLHQLEKRGLARSMPNDGVRSEPV